MTPLPDNAVHPETLARWRAWLKRHHTRAEGVWLVEWQLAPPGWLELAYGDMPPWPRTTVRRLTALRGVGASGG
jgi:hypothetical protein